MTKEEILKIQRKYGPLTRDQIAKIAGLPRTTIHNKLTKLLLRRKVKRRVEKQVEEEDQKSTGNHSGTKSNAISLKVASLK